MSVKELCKKHGFSDASFYSWRAKFGEMAVSEAQRLKNLEEENSRLKTLLAEAMLDLSLPRRDDPPPVQIKRYSQREYFLSVECTQLDCGPPQKRARCPHRSDRLCTVLPLRRLYYLAALRCSTSNECTSPVSVGFCAGFRGRGRYFAGAGSRYSRPCVKPRGATVR